MEFVNFMLALELISMNVTIKMNVKKVTVIFLTFSVMSEEYPYHSVLRQGNIPNIQCCVRVISLTFSVMSGEYPKHSVLCQGNIPDDVVASSSSRHQAASRAFESFLQEGFVHQRQVNSALKRKHQYYYFS